MLYQVDFVFSLIKEPFELQDNNQASFKFLKDVQSFLLNTANMIQLIMNDNFLHKRDFADIETFLDIFRQCTPQIHSSQNTHVN